jgi:hypothetical protein
MAQPGSVNVSAGRLYHVILDDGRDPNLHLTLESVR